MKRVLILCDLFPPAFGPRMGYLCKYLKQAGWQVEVIAEAMDDQTFAFLADSCPVTFVPYYTAKNKFLRKLQWIFTLLADFLFSYKDRKMAKAAHRICQHQAFDLILCSSFRTFPLVAARLTAQRHHLPLVVDLRDIIEQYAGNEFLSHSFHVCPWLDKQLTALLKRKLLNDRNRTLRMASQVTTVSPWHVEQLMQYNPNVSLIYNGYDPDLFYPDHRPNRRFTITYTGRILSLAMRNPELLFKGVLLSGLSAEQITLEWYVDPASEALLKEAAAQYQVSEYMSYQSYVPASEIPSVLNSSSMLLLLTEKSGEHAPKGIMTTKFFEALAVDKPILCVPSDESYLEENIRRTRSGLAARSAEEVAQFILQYYRQWETQGYTATTPDHEEIKRFSRKGQAEQFMQLFETLSILIPTYNKVCVLLVEAMRHQAQQLQIPFEILVVDDGSSAEIQAENRRIEAWENCHYRILPQNVGPARIRNVLADQAHYPYLLFMDADTMPASSTFLRSYWEQRMKGGIVCGGFIYERMNTPAMCPLRYQYGIQVEERSAEERNRQPYSQFISMCFLADKEVFQTVRFDDTMHFGYEDAWFGILLQQAAVPLKYIDNPVFHQTTDKADDYLRKIRFSIQNLAAHRHRLQPYIRLLQWHHKAERLHLTRWIRLVFTWTEPWLVRNLTGTHPSMHLFAFYKLGYLCQWLNQTRRSDN